MPNDKGEKLNLLGLKDGISDCYENLNALPVREVWCKKTQRPKVFKNNNH